MANKSFVEKAAEGVGYGLAMAEDAAGTVKTALGAAVTTVTTAFKKSPVKKAAKKTAKKSPAKKSGKAAAKKSPAKKSAPKKAAKKSPKKTAKKSTRPRR